MLKKKVSCVNSLFVSSNDVWEKAGVDIYFTYKLISRLYHSITSYISSQKRDICRVSSTTTSETTSMNSSRFGDVNKKRSHHLNQDKVVIYRESNITFMGYGS